MALTTYQQWKNAIRHPAQSWSFAKAVQSSAGTNHYNQMWNVGGTPGAGGIPGAAAALTSASAGALGQLNPTGGKTLLGCLKRYDDGQAGNSTSSTWLLVVDRLSQMGGLSGTVTTAQTVNTAALTRFTSGVGVIAACEVFTAIGATATTVTMSYTNQGGISGKTSQPVAIGGASLDAASVVVPMSMASGDSGVQSVQSVTLLATTGTAGSFGVTLYMPLAMYPLMLPLPYSHRGDGVEYGTPLFVVPNNACLSVLKFSEGAINAYTEAEFAFMEV